MVKKTTPKRKSISQKTRFEVFKRDSFTCQYCGAKAPDVLLEVDHIKPVASGGTNSLINLVTSCATCNRGKSKNELDDQSVLEKQRRQLEELEQRRQQLEMMMQWHTGLQDFSEDEVTKYVEYFNKANHCDVSLTQTGKTNAKKLIKKFGFKKVLEAIDIVATKYSHLEVEDRFKKLGGVLVYETASETEKQAMYIKGVCKNRLAYFDFKYGTELIRKALDDYQYDFVLEIAKTARNWTQWRAHMEDLTTDTSDPDMPF